MDKSELLMPFVVCQSNGGPYQDSAFVAGARFGRWCELLKLQPQQHMEYEHPELVPQLDLLAMHHNYTMTAEPFDDDWTLVTMTFGPDPRDSDASDRTGRAT